MNKEKYATMQRSWYDDRAGQMKKNHALHNNNKDYWDVLLKPAHKHKGGIALDFGCGHGRNVMNMLELGIFSRVDGVDISAGNIEFATKNVNNNNSILWTNNGLDLSDAEDNTYDFVMSTIVLQHICCYDIRYGLLSEIYRVMKDGGTFSFQMGFGEGHPKTSNYHENSFDATGTNSKHDVKVVNTSDVTNDLAKIGFKKIQYKILDSYSDLHKSWLYITCEK